MRRTNIKEGWSKTKMCKRDGWKDEWKDERMNDWMTEYILVSQIP